MFEHQARDTASASVRQRGEGARSTRRAPGAVRRAVGNSAVAGGAAAVLDALNGPGTAIEAASRAAVERATGQDLGDVRLHTGPRVRVAARAARAAGFTIGRDIGIATGPGQPIPQALLDHELVHAAQQAFIGAASAADAENQAGQGIGALGTLTSPPEPYVAFAPEDWLGTTPDIQHYGLSELLDELRAVDEWLGRQIATSPDVIRMQEAQTALQHEIARRRRVIAGPAPRPQRPRPGRPATPEPEQPTDMPHVLRDRSSQQLTDPAEMRAEVDRIAAWLQRTDVTRADRRILQQELASLAPQLDADLGRTSGERRRARLARALTPVDAGDKASVLANLRIVESIRPYDAQPGMAYVLHEHELLVFPAATADRVRAEVLTALSDAARRARNINDSTKFRMSEHMRLNYEEHPVVGFAVSLVSGEEAVELQSRMLDPLSNSTIALSRFSLAARRGSLVDMAEAVFAAMENAETAQQIVLDGIDRSIAAAGSIVHGLEITRNLAFTVALSVGAILAAPVVAAGVAGFGATGLTATALTAVGTGGVVGAEGFGLGFVSGTGSALASGRGAGDSLRAGVSEGGRVGAQGVAIGVGGGASLGLASNLGVGAQGLSRLGLIGRNALAQGGGNALGGITGALLTPPEGVDRGTAAFRAGVSGLALGVFGGAAGTYAQGLSSPAAKWAVGVGLPSVVGGGATYLQTGSLEQSIEAGGTALAVGSLTLNRGTEPDPETLQGAFQAGRSARRAVGSAGNLVRSAAAGVLIGTAEPLPPLRLGAPGWSTAALTLPTVSRPAAALSEPATLPAVQAAPVVEEAPVAPTPTPVTEEPAPAASPTPAPPQQVTSAVTAAAALARRPVLARELAALGSDAASAARRAVLQARLARLQVVDDTSAAPSGARIVEVSADPADPNYYGNVASTVGGPSTVLEFPDGTRVWRDSVAGPIRHESTLGPGEGRAGMERGMYTATEHGNLPAGPRYQRAHSIGQGTGFESPYGILYAPEYVNQTLQNHGIEAYLRDVAASAAPGETFRIVTTTRPHPRALRLASVDYTLIRINGGIAEEVATYSIQVGNSAEHPVVTAGALRFAPTPAGQALAARVPIPPILTGPASFTY